LRDFSGQAEALFIPGRNVDHKNVQVEDHNGDVSDRMYSSLHCSRSSSTVCAESSVDHGAAGDVIATLLQYVVE
jgi:hypothetical protein